MKNYKLLNLISTLAIACTSASSFALDSNYTSCIPYYKKRIEVIAHRLNTLGIVGPAAQALSKLAPEPGPTAVSALYLGLATKLQWELANRTYMLETLAGALNFASETPDPNQAPLSVVRFWHRAAKKYPVLRNMPNDQIKPLAQDVAEADRKLVFCNGDLKRKAFEWDPNFKKNLAHVGQFNEYIDELIEKRFYSRCTELRGRKYRKCMNEVNDSSQNNG